MSKAICAAQGVKSEVPETLVPGFSFDSTNWAVFGSVTEETKIGMSLVVLATACAAGVAIAKIKSLWSLTNFCAMVTQLACSPCAF